MVAERSTGEHVARVAVADSGGIGGDPLRSQAGSAGGRVIREFYKAADPLLQHNRVMFNDAMIEAIADAFAEVSAQRRYTTYACAILRDHVHVVIRRHKHQAEEMIANLQEASSSGLRRFARFGGDHPIWGGAGWKVFLKTPNEIQRCVRYVENNPTKSRVTHQS